MSGGSCTCKSEWYYPGASGAAQATSGTFSGCSATPDSAEPWCYVDNADCLDACGNAPTLSTGGAESHLLTTADDVRKMYEEITGEPLDELIDDY